MDINRFLPVLTQSPTSIMKGSVSLSIWAGQLFILLMVSCKVKDKSNLTKAIIVSILIIISIITTITIAIFGSNTEMLSFPFLSLAKYVSSENILQRMDTIILTIWISSIFFKLSVFIYTGTQITIALKKTKNNIINIILFSAIVLVLSEVLWKNSLELKTRYLNKIDKI